jgi:hypothetical protein
MASVWRPSTPGFGPMPTFRYRLAVIQRDRRCSTFSSRALSSNSPNVATGAWMVADARDLDVVAVLRAYDAAFQGAGP